ncbi:MAG: HEAT repeat domain-containing protein [Dermatophilaceae bacterium]
MTVDDRPPTRRAADVRRVRQHVAIGMAVAGVLAVGGCTDDAHDNLTDLRASQQHVRATAAASLGAAGDQSALAPLSAALTDPSAEVRESAARALARLGAPGVAALIGALSGTKTGTVDAATTALAGLGESVVEPLMTAAEGAAYPATARIASLLAASHDSRATPALLAALADPRSTGRDALIVALGGFRTPEATTGLIRLYATGDDADRAAAKKQVSAQGDSALPVLMTALTSTDAAVRRGAVALVSDAPDRATVTALLAMTKDHDRATRTAVYAALGASGDPRAAKPLIAALADKTLGDISRTGLARLGRKASSALVEAYAAARPSGHSVLARYLATGATTADLARLLRDRDTVDAYLVLVRRGDASGIPALVKALGRFGDPAMALAYLNCGNAKLDAAATTWAKAHGYRVVRSEGTRRGPQWGSAG